MRNASTILRRARTWVAAGLLAATAQGVGCAAWYDDSEQIRPAYLEARELYEGSYADGPANDADGGDYDTGDYLPPGPITQGLADAGVYTPPHGDVTVYDDGYLPPINGYGYENTPYDEGRYGAAAYAPAYSGSSLNYYSRFGLDSSYYGLYGRPYPRYGVSPYYYGYGFGSRYRRFGDDTFYPRGRDRDRNDRPRNDRDARDEVRVDRTPRQPPPTRVDSRRSGSVSGRSDDRNARAAQQALERRGVERTRAADRVQAAERARSSDRAREVDRARSVDRDASRGGRSNDRADRGSSRESRPSAERRSDAPRREAPARSSGAPARSSGDSGRRR